MSSSSLLRPFGRNLRIAAGRRVVSRAASTEAKVLRFHKNGNPSRVLALETEALPALTGSQVLMRVLAAPINPADFNSIQGNYGKQKTLPAIAGLEGCGIIEAVGPNVQNLKVNQRVIPATPELGMWRTHAICGENDVIPVGDNIPVEYSATLSVNPCTALRMLEDFEQLKAGDVVVQNGANSMVGQAVIQIAAARGIKTINLVRKENHMLAETIEHLKALGGTVVVDDGYAATNAMRTLVADMPAKLGLNCVGGASATDVSRMIGDNGTMVTYGAMSRGPLPVAASSLIFRNITLKGFWMTRWVEQHSREERKAMLATLEQMIHKGQLKLQMHSAPFNMWQEALDRSTDITNKRKIVLKME